MKISHLSIKNILGIKSLEFDAGRFVEVAGRNGQGKTSVLEAVKATLGGGHDATLLRTGEETGEAVLVLDDGTEVTRKVSAEGSSTTVRRDGKKVGKPIDVLKKLVDMSSVNPIDFLRATKKDRAQTLLKSMPIIADEAKLAELSGHSLDVPDGTHGLQVIEMYRTTVYDERTGTNRAVREKDATINQLRNALPDAPGGIEGDEDSLRAQIDAARAKHRAEEERITTKLAGLREERDNDIAKIEQQIADLRVQIEKRRQTFSDVEGKANAQRNINNVALSQTITPLQAAVQAIAANRDAAAKRAATLQTIAQMEGELEDLKGDVQKQSDSLDAIDAYKQELLNSLPIPGLEVRDGDIYRDGVQFDRLNTAQQVEIAVEIAKLRAGELKLIAVDGLELLDSARFEAFKAQVLASGFQLFVSRVTDEDFTVISE